MNYVDGFVVPVPKKKLAAYKAMSKLAGKSRARWGETPWGAPGELPEPEPAAEST